MKEISREKKRLLIAFLMAIMGYTAIMVVFLNSIFRSTSSTAAIGIFFIPFRAFPFFILFFIFGYCLLDLLYCLKGDVNKFSLLITLRVLVAAILLICGVSYLTYGIMLTHTVTRARTLKRSEINGFLKNSIFKNNKFVLGAIVQNPNVPASALDRIALMKDSELYHRMWSTWPVMGKNRKGFAVMRLVAMNEKTSVATLVFLSKCADGYVLSSVAGNKKTPVSILRKLYNNYLNSSFCEQELSCNPNTPAFILKKLAKTGGKYNSEYTRAAVASNTNTPTEVLVQLSKNSESFVRSSVACNSNTPLRTLEKLCEDSNTWVSSNAKSSLKRRGYFKFEDKSQRTPLPVVGKTMRLSKIKTKNDNTNRIGRKSETLLPTGFKTKKICLSNKPIKVDLKKIITAGVHTQNQPGFFFMSIKTPIAPTVNEYYSNISHELVVKIWDLGNLKFEDFVKKQEQYKSKSWQNATKTIFRPGNEAITLVDWNSSSSECRKYKIRTKECVFYKKYSSVILVIGYTSNDVLMELSQKVRDIAIGYVRCTIKSIMVNGKEINKQDLIINQVGKL